MGEGVASGQTEMAVPRGEALGHCWQQFAPGRATETMGML